MHRYVQRMNLDLVPSFAQLSQLELCRSFLEGSTESIHICSDVLQELWEEWTSDLYQGLKESTGVSDARELDDGWFKCIKPKGHEEFDGSTTIMAIGDALKHYAKYHEWEEEVNYRGEARKKMGSSCVQIDRYVSTPSW